MTKNCSYEKQAHVIFAKGLPTEKNNADMNLNTQILIVAILGLTFGFILTLYPDTAFVKHSLYGLGILSSVFIGLLKMLLVLGFVFKK